MLLFHIYQDIFLFTLYHIILI